ncbi:hypothetical protein HPG69_016876 [Diceros bicornis minor]|uniref:Uncharacterized protein n=1 Tax=Diceros bicornis minor TaxID=77932 RepID=A0A7J7EBP7_DICBM|nr:hypothetical protein HPG69_016876 [Diceros bicornis minor]
MSPMEEWLRDQFRRKGISSFRQKMVAAWAGLPTIGNEAKGRERHKPEASSMPPSTTKIASLFPAVPLVHPPNLIVTSDSSRRRGHPSPWRVSFPSPSSSARTKPSPVPTVWGLRHPQASYYLARPAMRPPSSPLHVFPRISTGLSLCLSHHDWLSVLYHPPYLPHQSAGPLALALPFYPVPPHMLLPTSVPLRPRPRLYFCPPLNVVLCSRSLPLCPLRPLLTAPPWAGRVCGPLPSLTHGTLPCSTFSTLNPSQQSPGSSQAPGTGGCRAQWGAPAAAAAPPREQTLPMGARRRDFRCPAEGGGSELLWCGALGGRRPGGPGAAAGLGAQPSGCRGGTGRTRRGARGPRVRGRVPRGEAVPPRGICPAASLPSSRKKAGAGGGPRNLLATRARSPRGAAASWDALPDAPAEG